MNNHTQPAIPAIKICGVTTAEMAASAAQLGVDYIGLVFDKPSKRYVDLQLAKQIASAANESGAKVVAIFTEHDAAEMFAICDACNIDCIQLHGELARREHHLLPAYFKRIYVYEIAEDGTSKFDAASFSTLDPMRDYLLFDGMQPGCGKTFPWIAFHCETNFRFGIAGGLNSQNVSLAIEHFQPHFLDVSSGVECSPGIKDLKRIRDFVHAVKSIKRVNL